MFYFTDLIWFVVARYPCEWFELNTWGWVGELSSFRYFGGDALGIAGCQLKSFGAMY